jgi:hypothetical protein
VKKKSSILWAIVWMVWIAGWASLPTNVSADQFSILFEPACWLVGLWGFALVMRLSCGFQAPGDPPPVRYQQGEAEIWLHTFGLAISPMLILQATYSINGLG